MRWTDEIDAYCERLETGLWAEPLNLLTNAAFLVAALVMARRLRGSGLPSGGGLVALLALIGLGSALWHSLAQAWTGVADVVPILAFVLVYIHAAHRQVWGQGRVVALAWTVAFVPYAALTAPLFARLPGLGDSAGYAPLPLLIAAHALLLRRRAPQVSRGFALGAGLLVISLAARTLDDPLCRVWPVGTHLVWHLLNAVMLAWMIEVLRRHHLRKASERLQAAVPTG